MKVSAEDPPGNQGHGLQHLLGACLETGRVGTAAGLQGGVPVAPGSWPRGPHGRRTPRPPASPRRLITFASGPGGGGAASCTSPPLGALAERGNSFPLTSSSEMQKISDFDR